jgi:hypothetical protein
MVTLAILLRPLFGMSQLRVIKWDIKGHLAAEDHGAISEACYKFLFIRIL